MQINFWDCIYGYSEDEYDENLDDYDWVYYCEHPDSCGHCPLENKYGDDKDDCKLLDK